MQKEQIAKLSSMIFAALVAQNGMTQEFSDASEVAAISQLQNSTFVDLLLKAKVDVVNLDGSFWLDNSLLEEASIEANFHGFSLEKLDEDQPALQTKIMINAPREIVEDIGNGVFDNVQTIRCLSAVPVELEELLREFEQA